MASATACTLAEQHIAGQSSARAASDAIAIEAVRDRAGFQRISTHWDAIEQHSPAPTIFQSLAWCRQILDLDTGRSAQALEPVILVARRHGRLLGLLPLRRLRRSGMILTGLGEPYQQYTDLVLAPGADGAGVLEAMLASEHLIDVDAVELRKVREDSALFRALGARARTLTPVDAAPFVELASFGDFASYHKSVSAKSCKNMRNQRNRLARMAPLTGTSYTTVEETGALISSSFEGRVEWLERAGLSSRAFRDPDFARFIARFANPAATGLEVLAVALKHGERVIAEQWGFIHKRRYYAYVASWDPAYEEASPGKLIMEEVLRAAHARGVEIADFLMPAAPYKLTWAAAATPVYDVVLPLSMKGHLTAKLWTGWLRPAAKRAMLAMPTRLRVNIAWVAALGGG